MSACNGNDESTTKREFYRTDPRNDIVVEGESEVFESMDDEATSDSSSGEEIVPTSDRMMIHRAYLHLRVRDYKQAEANIEKRVEQYKGYIVESFVYRNEKEIVNGSMTVKIPEQQFQNFLTEVEGEATNVIERNVTGEDVMEQYVDLEARLTSKRIVEERLQTFMQEAEKTEDLLKVSSDLAVVQEEIERLVGKMNYLENQIAFSTVDIQLFEDRVIMPSIDGKGQNTWEKTKKQFFTSINFLLSFGSSLIVFFIGNLPVILLVSVLAIGIYFLIRFVLRRQKK